MNGRYLSITCGSEYEIYRGSYMSGKTKVTGLLCKRVKSNVSGAVLGDPYPIEEDHIKKMIRVGSWKKIETI